MELHNRLKYALETYKINESIELVKEMLTRSGLTDKHSALENIRSTYYYMCHYMLEGIKDDGREKLLHNIVEQLNVLADLAMRKSESVANPGYYYSLLRLNNLRSESIEDLLKSYSTITSELSLAEAVENVDNELQKSKEDILERLFNTLYTSFEESDNYKTLANSLISGYADDYIVTQSISVLTLSLLQFYDRTKLITLIDIFEKSEDNKILARCLIAILFTIEKYKDRVKIDSELIDRLSLWNDSLETYAQIRDCIRIIVGTRDTARVAEKMNKEVLPELLKIRPDILGKMKKNDDLPINPEDNPEWEEMLEKSGIADKMRELSEMQQDGADLMMVAFSNLKQFPFFNNACNWFLPFDIKHSCLNLSSEFQIILNSLVDNSQMICDSDLYSLALSASKMPDSARNAMINQLRGQLDQLKDNSDTNIQSTKRAGFKEEATKTVRDLYRFFKLYNRKNGMEDPFNKVFDFISLPALNEITSDIDVVRLIAEFYFKRGYYSDSLPLFNILESEAEGDGTLQEKIGFCYQQVGDLRSAKRYYERASFFNPSSDWTIRKLAYVSRKLGDNEDALRYYQQVLYNDPDNVSILINYANLLLYKQDYANALQNYYHVKYLDENNMKALRGIAWIELLNGNYSKSAELYNLIISKDAHAEDYLNAGHVALLMGQYKEARNFYGIAKSYAPDKFEEIYNKDIKTMVDRGADKVVMMLMLDQL